MRQIDEIVIHCSATAPNWGEGQPVEWKRDEINKWHKDNGWGAEYQGQTYNIGYHWVMDRDGSMAPGRPEEIPGAHTKGKNATTIGVCLLGGRGSEATDKFEDHYTPAQERALRKLIASLKVEFPSITKVSGHNEYANKACPGFKVKPWLENKPSPEQRTSLAQSKTIQASQVTKIASIATPMVGVFGGLEWPQLMIMAVLAVIVLGATGIIDMERIKKWKAGDR